MMSASSWLNAVSTVSSALKVFNILNGFCLMFLLFRMTSHVGYYSQHSQKCGVNVAKDGIIDEMRAVIFLCVRMHPNLWWSRHTSASTPPLLFLHILGKVSVHSTHMHHDCIFPDLYGSLLPRLVSRDSDPESIMVLIDTVQLSLYGMEHMHLQQALKQALDIKHTAHGQHGRSTSSCVSWEKRWQVCQCVSLHIQTGGYEV